MSGFDAVDRFAHPDAVVALCSQGVHPLMARLFAARGIARAEEIGGTLGELIAPSKLTGSETASRLLADAIAADQRILIVGDYDCDGATATAVAVAALRAFGATVDFLIPNRLTHGYGLSLDIARLVIAQKPDWIVTVDSGIADIAGVEAVKAAGIGVIVTDHHLPAAQLPPADAIVNPSLPDCLFPSKHLAGVGVIFYVMLQLRAELRRRGHFSGCIEPNLAQYLDLVALGTVADMVMLDQNNRILVSEGLKRIRSGCAQAGLLALLAVSGRRVQTASTEDFGFFVAPRLNAAGRLGDMTLGVETLLATDPDEARQLADRLDKLNRQRQTIQTKMIDSAERQLNRASDCRETITLHDDCWHEGVIGIVAGRLKDRHQKPTFVFAAAQDNTLKGSGRSVSTIHLHSILLAIHATHPGLLLRFGGHAAAAGVTIPGDRLDDFREAFEAVVVDELNGNALRPTIECDGSLDIRFCVAETARLIEQQVWGPGFPTPVFVDRFDIDKIQSVSDRHMKLFLRREGRQFEAIQFHVKQASPGDAVKIAYRLTTDRFRDRDALRLQIEEWVE